MVKKIQNFFQETVVEWKKVTWPTLEELRGSTAVVLLTILALSLYIGLADFILSGLVTNLLR